MNRSDIRAGLDTSVVVRLLIGEPAPLSQRAYNYLAETQEMGLRLTISDLVLAESYFACQTHYEVPKQQVLDGMQQLFSDPLFVLSPHAGRILSRPGLGSAKPGFIDRLIHAEYTGGGGHLVTFEKSAGRLPGSSILTVA